MLDWLVVILNLDHIGVMLCGLAETGKRLLLAGRGVLAQTVHSAFVGSDAEQSGRFCLLIGEVLAHRYNTLQLHPYVHYSGAGKKLLTAAFLMGEM